ncbi:MAG: sensor histidine kinase [Hyphomicrobiales bacterium]|nr:sensor histidine kinase [Hyphomicrobiales bacterium]MDE2016650.1 sensor histidine kinase [Hyphomicrobiales bacterium]
MAIAATATIVAGRVARGIQIDAEVKRSDRDLDRYVESLDAELGRFDYLPSALAAEPGVARVLRDPASHAAVDRVDRYLEKVGDAAGASALYVVNPVGRVLAASNWGAPVSFVGIDVSFRPYFQEAMRGGFGRFFGIGTTSGAAGYYFARPILSNGATLGVGVVKVDLDHLQSTWGRNSAGVMVLDGNGIVILASQSEWRYRTLAPLDRAVLARLRGTRQYGHANLTPIGLVEAAGSTPDRAMVSFAAGASLRGRAELLMRRRYLPRLGWTITLFSDLGYADSMAAAARVIVGLSAMSLFLLVSFWRQRRRVALTERAAKALLTRANNRLEREVAIRTRDLTEANSRLRRAHDELVHSAKLAVLGQLAAGITHEMTQPLAAIRTLSDNARTLLARGEPAAAGENLAMVSDLIRRMARMTGQLKLFARKSPPSFQPNDVTPCIDNALAILGEKRAAARADIRFDAPYRGLFVLCDGPRLEQVFVNLVANGIDAARAHEAPALSITVRDDATHVSIEIDDNGPGLSEEAMKRLFEPFYTTKPAGEGLGLGLSISEGIVRDFGGTLRASNLPTGGARFAVVLPRLGPRGRIAHV